VVSGHERNGGMKARTLAALDKGIKSSLPKDIATVVP
jgi:hypothetical protein